jgi:GntR family transcriptional regulator, hexuronate regulon transcriptional repressor
MKSRRLFWRIVEKIETMIDSGAFPAGSRLPPERELAETYNVSRPTIREAVIALEAREKVEARTGSGIYVMEHKKHNKIDLKVSAFELTQARALVEGEAAALASTTITSGELERLHQTLVDMESEDKAESADKQFHLIISQATRNNAILVAVDQLWQLRTSSPDIIAAYKGVCNQSASKRMAEHTAIYTALKQRDAAAARAAMHEHFNRLINALFDADEQKALEEMRRKTNEARGLYSLDHLVRSTT